MNIIEDVIATSVYNFFVIFWLYGRFLSFIFEIILHLSLLNGQYNSMLCCKNDVIKCKIQQYSIIHQF